MRCGGADVGGEGREGPEGRRQRWELKRAPAVAKPLVLAKVQVLLRGPHSLRLERCGAAAGPALSRWLCRSPMGADLQHLDLSAWTLDGAPSSGCVRTPTAALLPDAAVAAAVRCLP